MVGCFDRFGLIVGLPGWLCESEECCVGVCTVLLLWSGLSLVHVPKVLPVGHIACVRCDVVCYCFVEGEEFLLGNRCRVIIVSCLRGVQWWFWKEG